MRRMPPSTTPQRALTVTTADFDIALDMTVEEHVETALLFLEQSNAEFAAGDVL